uniref:Cytoplasmic tRNA 2-thiolation protein 1 C-terminal domain-containing protein n=2 Tax=Panagrolaimus sp. PS1159 TaxID=55785 RepID=A0AC35GW87_9BILA
MSTCYNCNEPPSIKIAKTNEPSCIPCFLHWFEEDVHQTIIETKIFQTGEKVAIGVSGGKDSTVLAHTMNILNQRHQYGLDLYLVCIDEGIEGYRDASIREVLINEEDLGLPLKILSYKDLYGWTMDEIVKKIGAKNNCTFCGVFRRQALDRGASKFGCLKVVTGHNADDVAETVMMNILRGDIARLERSASYVTGVEGGITRVKPFRYSYQKDIVFYAHFKKLNYFSVECTYSPNAYRGHVRNHLKALERISPRVIMEIVRSGEDVAVVKQDILPIQRRCIKCDYISSQELCQACKLLSGLNTGDTTNGISKQVKKNGITNELIEATENGKSNGGCGGECACTEKALDF